MSDIFHAVTPQYLAFVAFVYDPADGLALVTEKIAAIINDYFPAPTDAAIDENGVLTFSGIPEGYPNGQFTASPGDMISFNFGAPILASAPPPPSLAADYALIGPYGPSVPGA